jgi:hypothetical protein
MGAGEELAVRSAPASVPLALLDFTVPLLDAADLEVVVFFAVVAFVVFDAELDSDVMRFGALGVGVVVQAQVP